MRKAFLTEAICVGMVALLALSSGCTEKKSLSPTYRGPFLMKEYFPLNQGDEWIWEIMKDSVPELFVDGDVNLGEPFSDTNYNGIYDLGEDYEDLNSNGTYEGPNDRWGPGIPFIDRNSNGAYDPPNGRWDEGEFFIDSDSDGVYSSWGSTSLLKARIVEGTSVSSDGSVVSQRHFGAVGGPPGWFFVVRYNDDLLSNDKLGLRWHSHITGYVFSPQDDLKDLGPITIARSSVQFGDSVINADTSDASGSCTWISVFEGVDDIRVPAGHFRHCLRFKSVARGWTGNMQEYNGTSYQWYAEGVGLVKSIGPAKSQYSILASANVGGKNYP